MPVIQPTAEQYARMMALLMPPGRLRVDAASDLYKILLGASDELERVSGRVADMFAEADPEQTSELLPEFEEMLGLTASGTESERRAAVISHLLQNKLRRPADYKTVLASILGLDAADVEVIEHSRAHAVLVEDDTEIYRFFVYRDPGLAGSYDVTAAQNLLDLMAHSHTKGHVIESIAALCDDPESLCDRDILGGNAAEAFQVATGLAPSNAWAGTSTDLAGAETLQAGGSPEENVSVSWLRKNNGFSQVALRTDDGTIDAWELDVVSTFDFDAINGPSWIFVLVFRTTGGHPAATRNLYSDRDGSGNGAEITMAVDGSVTWAVDAAFRSLPQDYADDEWHVLAVRWRYDTGEIQIASELAVSTEATATSAVSSGQPASFGAGRLLALGCEIAFIAACSGDQVHDADLSAIATRMHAIMTPDITRP